MAVKFKISTFQNASLIRKFTILYFVMSIVPVGVIYYLYIFLKDTGSLEMVVFNYKGLSLNFDLFFFLAINFVLLGVLVGFIAMRKFLMDIVRVTHESAASVEHLLGRHNDFKFDKDNDEVKVLTKTFTEITSRLEENVRNLEIAKNTLHSVLARVGQGISSMDNIDSFLNLILETVADALSSKIGLLILRDEKEKRFYLKDVHGKKFDRRKRVYIDLEHSVVQQAIEERHTRVISELPQRELTPWLAKPPFLCAPLILHDSVLGCILVAERTEAGEYNGEEKNLLNNLALQTAVAIENSRLNEDAEKTYFETITALALAVEAKDTYSRGHSDRVATLVVKVAQEMNLSDEDIANLRDAAKMHDIGKIGITDEVLKKEGPLNDQEMEIMKQHVEIGSGIIKPIRSLGRLVDLVRHHHEKLDGGGYPDGLKGEEISPVVRILAVADIYDALSSERPYRKPYTPQMAIDEMRGMKDKIDQKVVEALAHIVL